MTTEAVKADPAVSSQPPRKRGQRILWIAGPLLVAVVGGWLYLSSGRFVGTDNAYVQADRIQVASQVAGRVVEVLVRENQPVKAGDVLFRLDPAPLQIAVDRAEATLAGVGDALVASRDEFHRAEATLRSAQSTLAWNEKELARQKELKARGLVSQKQLDDAAHEVAESRAERDANAAALAKAKNLIGGSLTGNTADIAPYRASQATLAQAKLDLEHAVVRAPVDGVIGKHDLQAGEFLAIGQPAMPLIATSELWIEANFKETDLTHVAVGQPAKLKVDTYPGIEWEAKVASISPASGAQYAVLPAQNATGNWVKVVQRIPVRLSIAIPRDAPQLRAGMSAEVEIDTGRQNTPLARLTGARDSIEPGQAIAGTDG